MNWSSVKNLLIAILIAANLFLLYNIARQDRTRGYIDENEVSGAVELLAERGLTVKEESIPLEKFKVPVYESPYSDEYYTEVAEALTDSKREMLYTLPEGGISITTQDGSSIEFDTEFGFRYVKNGISDIDAYTEITADSFASIARNNGEIAAARMKLLSEEAENFLNSRVPDDYVLTAKTTDGCYDDQNDITYLLSQQVLDGYDVYSHYAVCVFSGDELIFSHGRWYFAPFESEYNTDLCDQVNILFTDLATLRAGTVSLSDETVDSTPEDTRSDAAQSADNTLPTVVDMSACYVIYWNADKTALFFIPAWQIEHNNGLIIVYNAANSTVYSSVQ
ncbi:MAG: hypothetical protein IJF48_05420 [Clostridia bacterium]|nr:hypothetical protein [Clostridia bacterium]